MIVHTVLPLLYTQVLHSCAHNICNLVRTGLPSLCAQGKRYGVHRVNEVVHTVSPMLYAHAHKNTDVVHTMF